MFSPACCPLGTDFGLGKYYQEKEYCCKNCAFGLPCESGGPGMSGMCGLSGMAAPPHIDKPAVDFWSAVHFGVGMISGAAIPNRLAGYATIALFEAIEPSIWPDWGESQHNRFWDFIIGVAGYEAARYLLNRG